MAGEKRRIPFDCDRPNYYADDQPSGIGPEDTKSRPQNANDWCNYRSSFRCPVQEDQQAAILARGWKRHCVQLLDQSAGGFRVSYAGSAQFKPGQLLRLLSVAGEHEVRVVYALRDADETHIGLVDMGCVVRRSGALASGALFLIVVLATAALFQFFR